MAKKQAPKIGIVNIRFLISFTLCFVGALLTISAMTGMGWGILGHTSGLTREERGEADRSDRYMPVPGGEIDDLDEMEQDWHNRLTYPTGRFDPTWVRQAAAQDAQIARAVPA